MALFLSLLTALAVVAAPKQYQVESQVFVDGKLLASPRMVVNAGESASISEKSEKNALSLKVTSTPAKKGAVRLDYEIDYLSGTKQIKAKPSLVALFGEKAAIGLGEKEKEEIRIEALVRDLSEISQIVPTMEKDLGEEFASFAKHSDSYLEDLEIKEEE